VRGGILLDTESVRVGGEKKRKKGKKKKRQEREAGLVEGRRRPHRYFTSLHLEEGTLVLSLTIL